MVVVRERACVRARLGAAVQRRRLGGLMSRWGGPERADGGGISQALRLAWARPQVGTLTSSWSEQGVRSLLLLKQIEI